MSTRVLVPGPRVPMEQLPHGLLVVDAGDGERDWEVIHPVDCPVACPWWPGAPVYEGDAGFTAPIEHHRLCYVEWEVEQSGLDSLDVTEVVTTLGIHIDAWKHLPPGRYLIEGWYHPGGWAGADPVDPEGGLVLLGPS